MNPAEQRERFTAVSRVEKRMNDVEQDVELVVGKLAEQMVTDRQAHETLATDVHGLATAIIEDRATVERIVTDLQLRIAAVQRNFTGRTFGQRLRWLVRGV